MIDDHDTVDMPKLEDSSDDENIIATNAQRKLIVSQTRQAILEHFTRDNATKITQPKHRERGERPDTTTSPQGSVVESPPSADEPGGQQEHHEHAHEQTAGKAKPDISAVDKRHPGPRVSRQNILDRVIALEAEPQNQVGDMDGTLFQTVNVVTDYIDHAWVTTKNGQVNDRRAESAIMGTGQRIKGKAWADAVARTVA